MKLKTKNEQAEAPTGHVNLSYIGDHPDIKRSYRALDAEWVGELSKSIEQDGLDTPLIVWGGGSEYPTVEIEVNGKTQEIPSSLLIAGRHRRAALQKLRDRNKVRFDELFPQGIPVTMRNYESLSEVLCALLRENVARKEPSSEELLPVMIRLRDEFKFKAKDIAKSIGKSQSFVSLVFDIESELGEEGVEAMSTGTVKSKHALKAAAEVKKSKKTGKPIDPKAALAAAKDKSKAAADSGREREVKRASTKTLYGRYRSQPALGLGRKVLVLENLLEYVVGNTDTLLPELKKEPDAPVAKKKK